MSLNRPKNWAITNQILILIVNQKEPKSYAKLVKNPDTAVRNTNRTLAKFLTFC
jgi:hypothetical protein